MFPLKIDRDSTSTLPMYGLSKPGERNSTDKIWGEKIPGKLNRVKRFMRMGRLVDSTPFWVISVVDSLAACQ